MEEERLWSGTSRFGSLGGGSHSGQKPLKEGRGDVSTSLSAARQRVKRCQKP